MFAFTRKDIDARVVGNALVVSFNSVDVTKTWRAEMAGLASATLELKDDGKKFSVILKKPDAEETVATYSDRESAAYALDAISTAMLKGDTHVIASQGGQAMAIMTKLFKAVVVVLLLMVLYIVIGPLFMKPAGLLEKTGGMGIEKGQTRVTPGEPVPADSIFK